jgi:hypothetical protein
LNQEAEHPLSRFGVVAASAPGQGQPVKASLAR